MRRRYARSERIYREIGRLIISWNDLELHLRRLLYAISEDWFSIAALTVDINSDGLIRALKLLSAERDVEVIQINQITQQTIEETGRPFKLMGTIAEHVGRVADCADRLRLHRNIYTHCITSPTEHNPRFTLGGMTARNGRLATFDLPLRVTEIKKTTNLIERIVRYTQRVEKCVKQNSKVSRRSPKWPQKPELPKRPSRPLLMLGERIPFF
jgi:hypothetical protein